MPTIDRNNDEVQRDPVPDPMLKRVIAFAGGAIGAVVGLTGVGAAWPSATSLAGGAITAVSAIAGAAISVGAVLAVRRREK